MTLTVDQKIRMLIGEYTIQIAALQAENEQLKARVDKLIETGGLDEAERLNG